MHLLFHSAISCVRFLLELPIPQEDATDVCVLCSRATACSPRDSHMAWRTSLHWLVSVHPGPRRSLLALLWHVGKGLSSYAVSVSSCRSRWRSAGASSVTVGQFAIGAPLLSGSVSIATFRLARGNLLALCTVVQVQAPRRSFAHFADYHAAHHQWRAGTQTLTNGS